MLDVRSRRVLPTIRLPHKAYVTGLRFTTAGTIEIVSTTGDEAQPALFVRHDARTGRRLLGPMPVTRRHYSPLLATSDGRRLITAGDGDVIVRDASTLKPLERFRVPGATAMRWPTGYALSPDDRTVSIGERDGAVRLLDLRTGAVRIASGRHEYHVGAAQFTPDGRTLITGAEDDKVIVWDVRQAVAVETLSGHASGVELLRIAQDGQTVYTASLDGAVFIWDRVGTKRFARLFKASPGGRRFRRSAQLGRSPVRARSGRRHGHDHRHAHADSARGLRRRRQRRPDPPRLRARQPAPARGP